MSSSHTQAGLSKPDNAKLVQLLPNCVALTENPTTFSTDHGCPIEHNDDSLKAGARGPTLMEDFHFREKIMRFDHERIPERAVHARGTAAHGYFQVYEDFSELTKAKFLCNPSAKTPVFVRFSTVLGSRGSIDTARDVRGFAVKFYTEEGNFDLVGNNIPVFFIQDAIKFPDLVHAAKPEPNHEIPQAQTAHDTFWDFISLMPESMHMVMWVLSDRAIPRSYSMMQGFGVHTFRLINAQGKARFVKFHWLPVLGVHSLVWDESQKIAGKDPDFHRRDLWESIELGNFPEFELAVQIVEEGDEKKFDFDLLDATKIIPEELVPLRKIGKLVLNGNPTNFFAETEQVAFCVNNFVPGIGPTDDPLMQGRLFSYLDTQLTRLGGPNFQTIPINRPVCPVINFNSDGFHFDRIPKCPINYWPNSLGHGRPAMSQEYQFYREPISGTKNNRRSPSFSDHFSQARLFYNSLSPIEKMHLIEAAQFELGKCEAKHVVERVVGLFNKIDNEMATLVAGGLGLAAPKPDEATDYHKKVSPALSQLARIGDPKAGLKGRKIAVIALDGCRFSQVEELKSAIFNAGGAVKLVSQFRSLKADNGALCDVDFTFYTGASVLFDGIIFVGSPIEKLKAMGDATHWLFEAYKHSKTIGLLGSAVGLLAGTPLSARSIAQGSQTVVSELGVVTAKEGASVREFFASFAEAMNQHRHWDRVQGKESALWQQIPA